MTLLQWAETGATWILLSPSCLALIVLAALAFGVTLGRASKRKRLAPKRYIFDRGLGL